MKYWAYKAYDATYQSHEGVITGSGLEDVALKIRQQNKLQLMELTSISRHKYNTIIRREREIESLRPVESLTESMEFTHKYSHTPMQYQPMLFGILLGLLILLALEIYRLAR